MRHLSIDIETKSNLDIKKAGAYKYAQSPDFAILLFAYKVDAEPAIVIDLAEGETIPKEIIKALEDETVIKHAYNAAFEWWCLNQAGYKTDITQWQCTMVHGLYLGYPAGLETIGKAIGLPQDKQKLTAGKALIKYFCSPCKPTKTNGGRKWNLPQHDPDRWKLFKEYNAQDVEAEYAILQRLKSFPMPEIEWDRWRDSVSMNAYGVRVSDRVIGGALEIDRQSTHELMKKAKALTGLDNPKSRNQFLGWLQENADPTIPDAKKETLLALLESDVSGAVREAIELKLKLGKTSVGKYKAMAEALGYDGRVRGLLQFYGANRTGRYAGRLVQVQNLPRNYIKTLDLARNMVIKHKFEDIKYIYGNAPDTLSQLIRTAFIPSEGGKFIVSDFSAIEARVLAWLAGETWANEVFATSGKIYEATASQMFGIPVEKIVKGNPEYALRQKGKVATLALGYQGGTHALESMGALNMGLTEDELPDIVTRWRNANPNIVSLWYRVDEAALDTVENGNVNVVGRVTTRLECDPIYGQSFLTVELPSGRKLFYNSPHLEVNRFGRDAVHFMGLNQTTKKWEVESTYGGKLVENITQAIARDCLQVALDRIKAARYRIVMHIHDEVVIDAREDEKLEDVNAILAMPINWAPGLILRGAGFESEYYMKD